MKKHFNKNLILSEKEEELFQSSNTCWICKKLVYDDDEKDEWSCNINLQLTKNVPVMFHNLRSYDSHLTFCELNKLDVKSEVIPNRLQKYMAFSFFAF